MDELNDPYELLGIQLPDKDIRKAFKQTRDQMSLQYGLLCFSRLWSNPVLWSHYGDKHYGIALGFDVPNDKLEKINYVSSLLSAEYHEWFAEGAEKLMNKLLHQKYIDWQYEDEYRSWVNLEEKDKDTGKYFVDFSNSLLLREIILGPRNTMKRQELINIIKPYAKGVEIIKTRLAFNTYTVVRNKKYKRILIHA